MKVLLIHWNILGKHFSQATSCSKHGLQIPSYTKISNIFYRINMMVKVARCRSSRTSLSQALTVIYRKMRLQHKMFSCEFCNTFGKHVWVVTTSAKYHFLCCVDFITKMSLLTLPHCHFQLILLDLCLGETFSHSFLPAYVCLACIKSFKKA